MHFATPFFWKPSTIILAATSLNVCDLNVSRQQLIKMVALKEFTERICIGWIATQPSSILYKTLTVCFSIANIVLSLCGTTANVLIILSYCRCRNLRVVQNTLFALLAVTDLTITALVQPIYIVANLQSVISIYDCGLWFVIYVISCLCLALSLVTVTILSLHSFVTLAFPYHYQRLVPYLKALIALSWASFVIVVSLLVCFASQRVFTTAGAGLIVFTILTVTVTWLWTYKLIRRHRRRIATSQTPTNFTGNLVARWRVLRSTTTAYMVVGGLITCYALGFARLIYEVNMSRENWEILEYVLRPMSTTFMYGNSLLNPCLVLWRNTEFRKAAKRILC